MRNEIESSIEKSFLLSNLIDISTDISEIAIDSVLKDGLLKDIPIIGTLINIGKLGINIRDYIYMKKVLKFLFNFQNMSLNDRNNLINKFENDPKGRIKFGEYLMTLIDKLDEYEKADFVAHCFTAYYKNDISYTELLRLNHSISHLLIANIGELKSFYQVGDYYLFEESALQNLVYCGLVLTTTSLGPIIGVLPSELGEKFMMHILGIKITLKAVENRKKSEEKSFKKTKLN